jgi:hypothetical protein
MVDILPQLHMWCLDSPGLLGGLNEARSVLQDDLHAMTWLGKQHTCLSHISGYRHKSLAMKHQNGLIMKDFLP